MSGPTSYLVAGTAAFAVLFAAPVALSAILRVVEGPVVSGPTFGVEVRRHGLWALAWTTLGLAPAALATRAAGESPTAWSLAMIVVAAAAFARIGLSRSAGPLASRVLWGTLEAMLVLWGFFLFDLILDAA